MPFEGATESFHEVHTQGSEAYIGGSAASLSREAQQLFAEAEPVSRSWAPEQHLAFSEPAEKAEKNTGQAVPDLDKKRQRLSDLVVDSLTKKKDREKFGNAMENFEIRAQNQGLTDGQVAQCYTEMSRILESASSSPLNKKDRLRLVLHFISHAADPTTVDQGHHKTCATASLEARTYTRSPEKIAGLIADVAVTGEFKTLNGIRVVIDGKSLEPDWEAGTKWPRDGSRSFANQIFQVTAVNVKWQMSIFDPSGNRVSLGDIRYQQQDSGPAIIRMSGDSGERLIDYGKSPPVELSRQPELKVGDVRLMHNVIVGDGLDDFLIENTQLANPQSRRVSSVQELNDQLAAIKTAGLLPAIIRVHTSYSPFNSGNQQGTWHLLSITDYDEKAGKVQLDNQWGSKNDRTVDLDDLYKATVPPPSVYDVNLNEILVLYEIGPPPPGESEF